MAKKKINYKKQGKRNRAKGARFERKIRADLESKRWIVSKWQNNVEFERTDAKKEDKDCIIINEEEAKKYFEKDLFCPIYTYFDNPTVKKYKLEYGEDHSPEVMKKIVLDKKAKCVPAKMGRYRTNQSGFPDFIAFRRSGEKIIDVDKMKNEFEKEGLGFFSVEVQEKMRKSFNVYSIIGVECKYGKYLSKKEKEKCRWLLNNNIFSKILVAYDGGKNPEDKRKRLIKYYGFGEKYGKD